MYPNVDKGVKLIISVFITFFLFSCGGDDEYVIHGKIRSVSEKEVYLMKMDHLGNMVVVDSAFIRGGEFRFRGHVDYPQMRFVRIGTRRPFNLFVENGKIEITGSMLLPDEIKIEGSFSHDDFNYLNTELESVQNKKAALLLELTKAQKLKDRKQVRELNQQFSSYQDTILLITKQFVLNNSSSVGAAYFLCSLSSYYDIRKLEDIILLFDPSIAECEYVKYLKDELLLRTDLKLGTPSPLFCLKNSSDDTICLEDYKGKYVYVDFGASWSSLSLSRYRQLLEIFDRYDSENFEIISISLDSDVCEWQNFLADFNPKWEFVSDFLYWSSPVTKHYRVLNIPYGVLIDSNGNLVLIDPSMSKLKRYLKQVFGY
jgi:peroxiredoxin